jgi:hypothetical protein
MQDHHLLPATNLPPDYFEAIRHAASRRWDQLESDPDLAGPWHQLFKQVQSPRHVLSELLQNADDAGATDADVRVEGETFVFSHDGEDFTREHFESLCRFGYSNKRALHTIGFRGVGFKSTFSLGRRVELFTPTLAVAFDRARFTEPKWIGAPPRQDARTLVRVRMTDSHRIRDIRKNLHDWLQSPISLLFFRHLRALRIGGESIRWRSAGPGPVAGTEWMSLEGREEPPLLVARSPAEPFPEESIREIREERLLGPDQETDLPPCQVELVLDGKGRLYVVLPTGVETGLPYSCNAPFIQDPARVKVKDPETSPTNTTALSSFPATVWHLGELDP